MREIVELLKAGPVYDAWSDDGPTQVVMQQAAAEITRLRSLIEEAGKVVGETLTFYDRVAAPHHRGEPDILDALSSLLDKMKEG